MTTRAAAATAEQKKAKITFWVKLGYGGFEGSYGLIWSIFYIFFMPFATDIVGIRPSLAGLIMMLSALGDAVSDPLTGIISDKLNTRWGRRRPILLAVAVPFGFVTWLLFMDPGWSETATVIYFSIIVIVFYTLIDLVWTPGLALGAEMTLDYDERTSLAGYRTAWDFAGGIVASATCLLVAKFFTEQLGSERAGWSAMAAVYGLVAALPVLLTWRATRGYERYREEEPKLKLKEIWQSVAGNKALLPIIGIYAFAGATCNCLGAVAVYYFTYYLKYSEEQISLLLGVYGLMMLAWVPVLSWLGRKIGKRLAVIYVYVVTVVVFVSLWLLRPMEGNAEIGLLIVIMSLVSCVPSALFLLAGAMIADAVEVDEFKTGQRREGVYFSVASFVQKLAIAFVLWGVGFVLEKAGYVAGAEQSASAITAIRALISWTPVALIATSIVFALLNSMTREKHATLLKALDSKKAGEEYDIEPIRNLVT
jgi:GPH family glycoside/pentoside/hexuronide:cation symporter